MVIASLVGVWLFNQPVDVRVGLEEISVQNSSLPPLHNAVVTLTLDNELKVDTISSYGKLALFANIPRSYLNKKTQIHVLCPDFQEIDTTLVLTQQVKINMYRDPKIYGFVRFKLWNILAESTVPGVEIDVDGHKVVSDESGIVSLFINLEEQKSVYPVTSDKFHLSDSIMMPCGNDDVILVNP